MGIEGHDRERQDSQLVRKEVGCLRGPRSDIGSQAREGRGAIDKGGGGEVVVEALGFIEDLTNPSAYGGGEHDVKDKVEEEREVLDSEVRGSAVDGKAADDGEVGVGREGRARAGGRRRSCAPLRARPNVP